MSVDRETVEHLAYLVRLGLTENEKDALAMDLSRITDYFSQLQEIDTEHIYPTTSFSSLRNVMREDIVLPSLRQEEVLVNAPETEGPFIKIQSVLLDNT